MTSNATAFPSAGWRASPPPRRAGSNTRRKSQIDPAAVRQLREQEKLGPSAIAKRLGIGRASVYRVLGKEAA
jgi:DNA invertase Pin-like site-specific DNA recombinase